MEKWLILVLKQELHKTNLKHLILPESNEVFQKRKDEREEGKEERMEEKRKKGRNS